MKRLHIDFGVPSRFPGTTAIALLAAGLLLVFAAAWEYMGVRDEVANELARQAETAKLATTPPRPQVAQATPNLSEQTVNTINQAISQLNFPWEQLFTIFETGLPENVALLALESGNGRSLRITAESKSPEDMANFIEALANKKRLADITLVKHEINGQDINHPIRFVLDAHWGENAR